MDQPSQSQQPVYMTQQISPETQGAASTALWLEILFGIFGLLGVGHVYTGRIGLGIGLMVGWWIYVAIAVTISTLTLGIAGCLFGPLYLAGPIISGIQARTYMQQQGEGGSWKSVGLVAGGGCLLVVIVIGLLIGLGVLGTVLSEL